MQDLEALKVEGKSPCGMVTVTVTGQQMPLACDISDEAMAEGAKAVGEKVRPSFFIFVWPPHRSASMFLLFAVSARELVQRYR